MKIIKGRVRKSTGTSSPPHFLQIWPLSCLLFVVSPSQPQPATDNFIRIVKSMSPHNYHWHQLGFPLIPNPPSQIKKNYLEAVLPHTLIYRISHDTWEIVRRHWFIYHGFSLFVCLVLLTSFQVEFFKQISSFCGPWTLPRLYWESG